MKNIKNILYGFLAMAVLAALVFSCTKLLSREELTARAVKVVQSISGTDTSNAYLSVVLSNDRSTNPTDTAQQISAAASFVDSATGNALNITGLSINGRSFTRKPDSSYTFSYSDTTTTILNEGKALSGTNVSFKITGTSAADTVSQTVYMPKQVLNSATAFPILYFDLLQNQTVNWVPDAANPTGQVMIKIWYNASYSRFNSGDNTLSLTDKVLSYTVTDNGSYTIPTADLQAAFRANAYVWMMVGRGDDAKAILPISHKTVYFFTAASGTTNAMYCQCAVNWQNTTTALRCKSGSTTGEQEQEQKDLSICSATYNQTRWVAAGNNLTACPACNSSNCTGNNHKCINGACQTGRLMITSRVQQGSQCITNYGYVFSDGTNNFDHSTTSNGQCPIQ